VNLVARDDIAARIPSAGDADGDPRIRQMGDVVVGDGGVGDVAGGDADPAQKLGYLASRCRCEGLSP
jgi:hypothetical protein